LKKSEPQIDNELKVGLPEKCVCGSENLKIWGTRLNGRVKVELRCIRCGKVLWDKNDKNE